MPMHHIVIQINTSPKGLIALYQDDGIGFDMNEILIKKSGLGLFNMQHRAEIYGGHFMLNSLPGIGTEIEMEIPSHKYMLTN
jgi:signal transduction histidine kinase